MIKETLKKLRDVRAEGCVSILLPTHRTHPDNKRDFILLRNMLNEAKERILQEYDKRQVPETLANLEELAERIDPRYNLDGLAIYLNEEICEYVRLPMPVEPRIILDKTFATRDLLRALDQIENYYILRLSEQEAHLFGAFTDRIIDECIVNNFPHINELYTTDTLKASYPTVQENYHKEYLNRVDKDLQQVLREEPGLVIIAGADRNYHYFLEITDDKRPIIGHLPGNWDEESLVNLAQESWNLVQYYIWQESQKSMEQIGDAISKNRLITSLGDIWSAILEGRGDTLYVEKSYFQPAILEDGLVIAVDREDQPDVVPDLVDEMIEFQMKHGGKVSFMEDGALEEFGRIALKTRY
ncbi:MAG: hypothetical protein H6563_02335 [Lewinellaceae bacterium]|nr:hypothetical protein [Lewinellaceae bacterium]